MAERGEKAEKKVPAVRITNQFRAKSGFIYDLKSEEAPLTLSIAPRESPEDEGEWRVEARAARGEGGDAVSIDAWGPSRAEALQGVARIWAERRTELGLPSVNWDEVAVVLGEVRAL